MDIRKQKCKNLWLCGMTGRQQKAFSDKKWHILAHLFAYIEKNAYLCSVNKTSGTQMKTTQEYIDLLRENASELQSRFGVSSMYVFGSVARGEQRENSDIDVLVDMPATLREYGGAHAYLEKLLGCNVDLIRKHKHLNSFFLKQINKDAIFIF